MPKLTTPLTDTQIKNLKPKEKDYTLADGNGLQLLVKQSGSKLWEFRYTIDGKRKKASFGTYPNVPLAKAREKASMYQKMLKDEIDPIENKREKKQLKKDEVEKQVNTFELVFNKWVEVKRGKITKGSADKLQRTFELYFLPIIGQKPITEISKQEYIDLILRMRDKGIHYYAHKTKGMLQQFLNYLEETNILENAPQLRLENALPKPKETNYPHITDLRELGELLRAIDGYQGDISTKYALMLAPLVFVRPANIRFMEWNEIDFEKGIWKISADKMKVRSPHIVPLSKQAIKILKEIKKVNGVYKYVFVSPVSTLKPLITMRSISKREKSLCNGGRTFWIKSSKLTTRFIIVFCLLFLS